LANGAVPEAIAAAAAAMDYESEQAMELEALQAIFPDDLEEFEGSVPADWPQHGKVWAININPSAEVRQAQQRLRKRKNLYDDDDVGPEGCLAAV
jgi:hypothetical protein